MPDTVSRTTASCLTPLGIVSGAVARAAVADGSALPLRGGPEAFTRARLVWRAAESGGRLRQDMCSVPALTRLADQAGAGARWAGLLRTVTAPRHPFAGFDLAAPEDRPRIMGILNTTPDSFYPDSRATGAAACDRACRMRDAGADIIDIGGESTRPGARPVPPAVELDRVLPIVERLVAEGVIVSVDTRHAQTMRLALAAGARIVNDVSALTHDDDALASVVAGGGSVVLMHMQGDPATMQRNPHYEDPVSDIFSWLAARVAACQARGLPPGRMCVDPGIGFGKTPAHNTALLAGLATFQALGVAVLLGVSRKGFIAALGRGEPAGQRLAGSLAAACATATAADILRVHDPAETRQALTVWRHLQPPHAWSGAATGNDGACHAT